MLFAFAIAVLLLLLGGYTIRRQLGILARLRAATFVPSDDRAYQRKLAHRRLISSGLLIILAGMLAGAYLSGLEQQADLFGNKELDANGQKLPLTPEQKDFARFYYAYWCLVLVLLFLVVSLAIVDILSTRRYAWQQLRRIQTENRAMLERDLAMYRQQKINDRMKRE